MYFIDSSGRNFALLRFCAAPTFRLLVLVLIAIANVLM
jgi:hypothetical protein